MQSTIFVDCIRHFLLIENVMKNLIISVVIFCGLQSTIFADDNFIPEIPKFKGCCAKRIAPTDTNENVRPKISAQNTKHKKQSTKYKIVALSPAITEIIYALGAGDKIIAVSDFCEFPPEVKSKAKVGGVFNPSFEKMLSLRPNLLIYQGEFPRIKEFCKTYKIPVCNVQLDDIKTITNSIQQIGEKIGKSEKAKKLRRKICNSLRKIKSDKNIPVFVCVGREPGVVASCTTIGKKSFINEMLKIAGGSNVCEDVIGLYPTVSSEIILSRKPEIIFELCPARKVNKERIKEEWKLISKGARVIILTNDYLMVPGPRITKLFSQFKKYILEEEKKREGN